MDELIVAELRNQLIKNMFATDLSFVDGHFYRGVYSFYVLQNLSCSVFNEETKSLLINTIRFDHPLYHRILSASNKHYSFLKGNPRDINLFTFDANQELDRSSIERVSTDKPFILYAEEINCIFPYGNKASEDAIRRKVDSPNFLGFASHIKNTAICGNKLFNNKSYHLNLPVKDPYLSSNVVTRPLSEEEIILLYVGSFNCGPMQKYNRGFHIIDRAFSIAKKKCKKLKIVFVERHLHNQDLISKNEFPEDVLIINNPVGFSDLSYLMAATDIFILPSQCIHANSVADAIQHYMACITSDEIGFQELIVENGIKVPLPSREEIIPDYGRKYYSYEYSVIRNPGNAKTIKYIDMVADAIIDLYMDRQKLTEFRSASKNLIESIFSFTNHTETFNKIINNCY